MIDASVWIICNALHVAPAGSEVTVALGSSRGWARIAVRDAGPGIAEAERDAIFERFRRTSVSGDRTGGRTSGGAGLGLAIARQIVESHQGRITLSSEVGVGSTFVVWLPDRAVVGPTDRDETPPIVDPLGADRSATPSRG